MRIKAYLSGVQNRFITSEITNGTNIIINADVIVDEYTASRKDKIKLYYYNEGMSNYASYIEWNLEKEMTDDVRIPANGYDKEIIEFQG